MPGSKDRPFCAREAALPCNRRDNRLDLPHILDLCDEAGEPLGHQGAHVPGAACGPIDLASF